MTVGEVSERPADLVEGDGVPRLLITGEERDAIARLVDEFLARAPGRPVDERLNELAVQAHELPRRLRRVLTEFRLTGRPYGGLVLSGLPVDESLLGPTPTSYTEEPAGSEAERAGVLLLLAGSLLGAPFSFATQQRGRLVLDVFPVRGHEDSQLGSSSDTNLEWHTEDAFHPLRADWIMLFGMRNPDGVPTTFLPVQELELEPETRDTLFEDRFVILPDESHTLEFNSGTTGVEDGDHTTEGFDQIKALREQPPRIPLLTGDPRAPFVRLDPAFMVRELGDERAEKALGQTIDAVTGSLRDVVIGGGELLIIDNKRAVHGRKPFKARFDGTDRWLRRINVTADLRTSEDRRSGAHNRAVV